MDELHRTGDTQVFDLCHRETTEALRAALEQTEQEPVAHTDWEAVAADQAMTIALMQAEPVQEPVAWMHKETGLLRREISRPKGADWDTNYWEPLYATAQPTAEDIAQDWDLLKETQAALRDAWAILKKLKAVQDAARELVESDPDSAADTEGEAFAAWCALVAAIDDADTLLCEFGESHE
jgi:hypothetical protein